MSKGRSLIKIDSDVAFKLRTFALERHGKFHGAIKAEAEAAILAHIQRGHI